MNIFCLTKLTLPITLFGDAMCQITLCWVSKMADSVVRYSYNGTEYSFVSKDPAQIEDLECPKCLELVYEPVLTSCGHLFCQRCVRDLTKCPVCQKRLQCMRNQHDERRVKGLKVKCPNWEKGCEWQGDLGNTAQHTDTNCQMETILCPIGCKEMILRSYLKKHAETCPQRACKCPNCQFEDTFVNVTTTHRTVCEEFPLGCVAGCRSFHSRGNMAIHLTTCAEELVPCKYSSIGCDEVIKRKDLQTHLQDKKDYHLEKAMDMVVQLRMGLSEISATVRMMATGRAEGDMNHLLAPFCPWLQNMPTSYPRPPWVIKMEGFQEKKEKNKEWYSDPVYSHFGGYKMCLCVYANGISGTHVSGSVHLMRGDNDDNLKWPFKGTIKVSLLNQLEDGQHHTMRLWPPDCDIPKDASGRVTEGERAVSGFGKPQFISHQDLSYRPKVTEGERADTGWGQAKFIPQEDLIYCSIKNCQYLKDDTMFFRVDCIVPKLD